MDSSCKYRKKRGHKVTASLAIKQQTKTTDIKKRLQYEN
jgi:hypothetical protein